MQAHVASLSAKTAPIGKPAGRLISIPFLLLRASSAAGAFAMGLVQTLVFARVLSPDRFSIFILVGAIGYSLWLCDLGLAKILFVRLRKAHIAGGTDARAAAQASAVVLFYVILAVAGALGCFAVMALRPAFSMLDAADFALFFSYVALNLAWFTLRSISVSVDQYVYYERLEVIRRFGNMATLLAMLIGLPFTTFLIVSNALWLVLLTAAISRLLRYGALAPRAPHFPSDLAEFFVSNWNAIVRSGTSALGDLFIYTFPYYVVPVVFGLGAPVIILEATFRIFRGASVIYVAACDLAVPAQTRAFADGDGQRLVRATLMAAGLCSLPAAFACTVLIAAARPLFAFLLHGAATVPPAITPILVVLLISNLMQLVAQSPLQHTGYFREIARVSVSVAAAMAIATLLAVIAKLGVVGFLAAYAAVYAGGALYWTIALIRGPIYAASHPRRDDPHRPLGLIDSAPDMPPATTA